MHNRFGLEDLFSHWSVAVDPVEWHKELLLVITRLSTVVYCQCLQLVPSEGEYGIPDGGRRRPPAGVRPVAQLHSHFGK